MTNASIVNTSIQCFRQSLIIDIPYNAISTNIIVIDGAWGVRGGSPGLRV